MRWKEPWTQRCEGVMAWSAQKHSSFCATSCLNMIPRPYLFFPPYFPILILPSIVCSTREQLWLHLVWYIRVPVCTSYRPHRARDFFLKGPQFRQTPPSPSSHVPFYVWCIESGGFCVKWGLRIWVAVSRGRGPHILLILFRKLISYAPNFPHVLLRVYFKKVSPKGLRDLSCFSSPVLNGREKWIVFFDRTFYVQVLFTHHRNPAETRTTEACFLRRKWLNSALWKKVSGVLFRSFILDTRGF